MSAFLTVNPGDNPNEGRVKINYNFSIIDLSGGTGTSGNFLPLSGGTVSGTTNFNNGAVIQSGGTNLYSIFATSSSSDVTRVQTGLNIYTGGTGNLPTVNISAATLTSLSATTISGGTIYSGSTNLYDIFVNNSVVGDVIKTVRASTTAVLPGSPTYNNGASGVGATLTRGSNGALTAIDGVTLIVADRVLVKNQASTLQNGIYEVTAVGSAGAPYLLTRTTDADDTTDMDDLTVTSSEGTTNKSLLYAQQTNNPTIGSDAIVFSLISGVFVTQISSGTQAANQIPLWTSTARQLSKGSSGLTFNATTNVLTANNISGTTISGGTIYSGGTNLYNIFSAGSSVPGGSNTEVQFNDSGAFGGTSNLTFDKSLFTAKLAGSAHTITSDVATSSTVAGRSNTICGSAILSSIVGGYSNTISGGTSSIILGGTVNTICSSRKVSILGGNNNSVINSCNSSINGRYGTIYNSKDSFLIGNSGRVCSSNYVAVVGGTSCVYNASTHSSSLGGQNFINCSTHSSAVGGSNNKLTRSNFSIINGGANNVLSGLSTHSVINGGCTNKISGSSTFSTINGGAYNTIKYGSTHSSIVGGANSTICNASHSVIAGSFTSNINGAGSVNGIVGTTNSTISNSNNSVIIGAVTSNISNGCFSNILGGCCQSVGNSTGSTIIGGTDNYMYNSTRSVILGGSGLTLNAVFDTVFVPQLRISTATTNNNLTTLLGRDGSGNVNEKAISSITVSQNVQVFSGAMTSQFIDVASSPNAKIYVPSNNVNLRLSGFTSGSTGNITLLQNAVGNGTLTMTGASYTNYVVNGGGGIIILTSTASARDAISYYSDDGINLYWSTGYNYT